MWLKNRPDNHLAYASKLTFYFVLTDRGGVVYSPTDSFYVGPHFSAPK